MATLDESVGILVADQVPLICLDTCDFLDVVRGVKEGTTAHAESFRVMLENLGVDSSKFRVLITDLVRIEWNQNNQGTIKTVEEFLTTTAGSTRRITRARKAAGLSPTPADENLFDRELATSLVRLAEDVMDRAMVLQRDDSCVARALERVMEKRPPSCNDKIKDSIHWEHYLELSRRLRQSGHNQDRIFVSSNKKDFWDGDRPTLHADLIQEAFDAGLLFFGKLVSALGRIGVLSEP